MRLLSHLDLRITVIHEERRIAVPMVGGVGLEHWSIPDPELLTVMRAALRLRDGAFVDVGAHTGETLVKLLVTGERRTYVGVEPQPDAASYVKRLLDANGHPGDVLAAALGDHNGVAALRSGGELDDSASIVPGFRSNDGARELRIVPLVHGDDALAALGVDRAGIVKVDVEGAELEVLRGLAGTLQRDRPIVLCEILPIYDEATDTGRLRRSRADAVVGLAAEHAYRLLRVVPSGKLEPLERIETHGDLALREHVLAPIEDCERLVDALRA